MFLTIKSLTIAGAAILFPYLLRKYIRRARFTKLTRITDKVVIITGANCGIGYETAVDLAKRGGKIYIACRDSKRGNDALEKIRKESGSDKVYFLQMDLASMESIHQFSQKFCKLENKLDILVNNAGVYGKDKIEYTSDGFELHFGVNHLGHFLLTHLLLDLLKASKFSRIVMVSSMLHKFSNINKDDLMSEKSYGLMKSYGRSKLANILFSHELSKRLRETNITVNSCDPGTVKTEISRNQTTFQNFIHTLIFGFFLKTAWEGAQTQIRLSVDPDLDGVSGKYFVNCNETLPHKTAKDDELAKWLYEKSLQLVKLN